MGLAKGSTPYIRWSKENYFLAIKKLVKVNNIKLDYNIEILMDKSFKELKLIYKELHLQIYGSSRGSYGKDNVGNKHESYWSGVRRL